MKKNLLILSLFTSIIAAAQTGIEIDDSITSGGVTRTYRLYIPLIYNPATAVPLIMNFHGLGTTSALQESYGDFRKIADTANFIIVHPQGLVQAGINLTGWNNFFGPSQSLPDINFTSALIDTIKAHYNIKMSRIYSTGFSNGGFMSYVLACQLSGRFAAIASVSGSVVPAHLNACNTLHPMPIMEIHGTSDSIVEYDGTGGLVTCTKIDSLIKHWVVFNHCNPTPTTIDSLANISTIDSCRAVHYIYNGGDAPVEFYKIIGGGHSWPGATTTLGSVSQVGFTNQDFKANKEIWRFFSEQKSFVGINEQTVIKADFNIYPNPSNGLFTVSIPNTNSGNLSICVVDILGKEVFRLSDKNSSSEYRKQIDLQHIFQQEYIVLN